MREKTIFLLLAFLIIIASGGFYFFVSSNRSSSFQTSKSGTISLVKNQETRLDNTGVILKLTDSIIPTQGCRDCMTYVRVIIKTDKQQKILEYKIGGFAGLLQDQADAFNYHFKLKNTLENTVEIEYVKY